MPQGIIQLADLTQGLKDRMIGDEYTTGSPTAPLVGVKQFVRHRTGQRTLGIVDINSIITNIQPHFAFSRIWTAAPRMDANGSTITITSVGGSNTFTTQGTSGSVEISTGSLFEQTARGKWTSTTGNNAWAGFKSNEPVCWRGNVAGLGGFYYAIKFGCDEANLTFGDAVTTFETRIFAGLHGTSTTVGGGGLTTLTNVVAVLKNGDESYLCLAVHNATGGTGNVTQINTGIDLDVNKHYIFRAFCLPNGSEIYMSIEEVGAVLGAGTFFEYVFEDGVDNMPSNTAPLYPHLNLATGSWTSGTPPAVVVTFSNLFLATTF